MSRVAIKALMAAQEDFNLRYGVWPSIRVEVHGVSKELARRLTEDMALALGVDPSEDHVGEDAFWFKAQNEDSGIQVVVFYDLEPTERSDTDDGSGRGV